MGTLPIALSVCQHADVSEAELPDFVAVLTERIWYLTQSGRDMWCRPPHGFVVTSSAAATAFAAAIGTELDLAPIAIASKELVSTEGIAAMRSLDVTRIFVDPQIDPASGDVFGTILRIAPTGPAA
jgi:hypothetical protein